MALYHTIIERLIDYVTELDWSFIVTFILLAYGANQPKARRFFKKMCWCSLRTRYRTLLVGFLYGALLFVLRGSDTGQIEPLFKALIFAMTFHQLLIDRVIHFFTSGIRKPSDNPSMKSDDDQKKP